MYKKINDYEVLYLIGESNNFEILYKKYQPLIYKIMKRYEKTFKIYGYELEDLMQIGYLTLFKTSFLYQEYNHVLFYSYFISALRKAIINEMRVNESNKRKCLNLSFSYENNIPNTDIKYLDIISNSEEKCSITIGNYIVFKNSLSFVNSNIFELYYNGYSIKEISCLLDENINIIKDGINEIRKQVKVQRYE